MRINRILCCLFVATLFTAAGPARAGMVTIDFDTFPGGAAVATGTVLTNQYDSLGVVFTGFEDSVEHAPEIRSDLPGISAASAPNYLTNFVHYSSAAAENRLDEVWITFTVPVSGVNFDFNTAGATGSSDITFKIYDSSLVAELGTKNVMGVDQDFHHISLNETNIGRISVVQPSDEWWWALDNLQFTPVPTPSTLVGLLCMGAASLMAHGWRKRKRQTAA